MRSRLAGRGTRGRIGRVPTQPAPSPYPTPVWRIKGDAANYSGGNLTDWSATIGPQINPDPTYPPIEGAPALNGHAGVLMPTEGARMIVDSALASGLHNKWTLSVICWPDNDVGYADREYHFYAQNGSVSAPDHLVVGHQANAFSFTRPGVYANSTWRTVNAAPIAKPQVITYVFDAGLLTITRNGVGLGTNSGTDASHGLEDVNIGASYGPGAPTQHFKGSYYELAFWDSALTPTEVSAFDGEVQTYYAIDPDAYYPSDNSATLTMWLNSTGKYCAGSTLYEGTALAQWSDASGHGHHMLQGTGGQEPADGNRVNGRPTVLTGANKWMAGSTLQGTLTAASGAAYSVMLVAIPESVTATQANSVDARDGILADAGDYWAINVFDDSGTPSVGLYHYGGATYSRKDSGITLGEPVLIHAWFDGSTLNLRVGSRAAVSISAANLGPATNLRMGGDWNNAHKFDGEIAEVIFRNAADSDEMDADRAYMGRTYGVAY